MAPGVQCRLHLVFALHCGTREGNTLQCTVPLIRMSGVDRNPTDASDTLGSGLVIDVVALALIVMFIL
jgi:hypothetical protein